MNIERILLQLAHILKYFVLDAGWSIVLELQVLRVRTLLIQGKLCGYIFFLLLVIDQFLDEIFIEL